MPESVVGRWGESLAVRLPGDLAETAGLGDGQKVEIVASGDAVVIRRISSAATVETMFSGKSPENWREAYADAYDWGPDLGRERPYE